MWFSGVLGSAVGSIDLGASYQVLSVCSISRGGSLAMPRSGIAVQSCRPAQALPAVAPRRSRMWCYWLALSAEVVRRRCFSGGANCCRRSTDDGWNPTPQREYKLYFLFRWNPLYFFFFSFCFSFPPTILNFSPLFLPSHART